MDVNEISILVLDYVVDFLNDRPIGSKFHPKNNEFLIDGKTMARIIRYNGDLRATANISEINFFTKLMKQLEQEKDVESMVSRCRYSCETINNGNRYILLIKKYGALTLKGRLPKFLKRGERNNGSDNRNTNGEEPYNNGENPNGN